MKQKLKPAIITVILLLTVIFAACLDVERDNPNDPKSNSFRISFTSDHAANTTITGHEELVLTFTDSMDTLTLSLSGNMGTALETENIAWSTTTYNNDTLTLTPNPVVGTRHLWPEGSSTLIVECTSTEGPVMDSASVSYTVENAVYVASILDLTNPGAPDNPGTKLAPISSIKDAINNIAEPLYDTAVIRVALGTYQPNWRGNSERIEMVNGISLYGGYSSDFTSRNVSTYETIIEDISSSGGSTTDPNRAVHVPVTVIDSASTIIDGFTINLGSGSYNAGIFCEGDATIQNNLIEGQDTVTASITRAYGISISSASPIISYNTIDAGEWDGGGPERTYGIFVNTSNAEIDHNSIKAGHGSDSYGIYMENNSDLNITYNTIDAEVNGCRCVHIDDDSCAPIIDYNEFMSSSSTPLTIMIGIVEVVSEILPTSVSYNDFNYSILMLNVYYYVEGLTGIKDLGATNVSIDGGNAPLNTWGNYSSY